MKIFYEGRVMTCYLVNRIGRTPIAGKMIKKSIQFVCGLFGHTYDADWGYGGGEFADAWCRFCDHFEHVHKTSIWFRNREARSLMSQIITPENK